MAISKMKLSGEMGAKFKTAIKASHEFIIDQPTAMGGEGLGANPLEYFLSSIAGCIGAIGRIISNQKKLNVRGIKVDVIGEIDKDFLMGTTTEGRAGFVNILTIVDIDADMSKEEKENFLHDIESRCPVADNIVNSSTLICKIAE